MVLFKAVFQNENERLLCIYLIKLFTLFAPISLVIGIGSVNNSMRSWFCFPVCFSL